MKRVTPGTTLEELATLISEALERAGIIATLSGGAAVTLYSANDYQSYDLDFVTSARLAAIGGAIEPLGFHRITGARQFEHPETPYYVEFPPGPLAFGETTFSDDDATLAHTAFGTLRIVTATQIVMDRVAAFVHWNDNQSLDQAVMVARRQDVDWPALYEWAQHDGVAAAVIDRLRMRSGD